MPKTMPKDENWKRAGSRKDRATVMQAAATDPQPMTRQATRQNGRRADKMPVGVTQEAWHKQNGFAKIGKGKNRR